MKLSLPMALLATVATFTASGAPPSDNFQTITVTAHVPDTNAAQNAAKVLSLAEKAMNQYFARDVLTSRVSDLWIFPTRDLSSVFVQYELRDAKGGSSRHQLALIELHGEQIIRMVDLAGVPVARVASATSGG
jgi:hypothetical protein